MSVSVLSSRVSEKPPCVGLCVCLRASTCTHLHMHTHTHTHVSSDATVGEDQISDFGRLHAGVLPFGGDFVRCQTDMGKAYQRRICP